MHGMGLVCRNLPVEKIWETCGTGVLYLHVVHGAELGGGNRCWVCGDVDDWGGERSW